MGKSWFYLTLWRDTPSGMTDYLEVAIESKATASAEVITGNETVQGIEKTNYANANVERTAEAVSEITTITEVVWHVGGV